MIEPLLYDARCAVRVVLRDGAHSAAIVIVLALALAMNVTAFQVMAATLFKGYPVVRDNARMLFVDERFPTPACCVSYADFEVWRAEARAFQDMAFGVFRAATVSEGAGPIRDAQVAETTANTFGLLGVAPVLGRDFVSADEAPGAPPVLIVSHDYWTTRLGGRADVIDHVVSIDGAPVTIVGVLPRGIDFPSRNDFWMPLEQTDELRRIVGNGSYAFGRLAAGATEETARAELEAINARLAVERPATNLDVRPVVRNFMDAWAGHNGRLVYGSLWAGAWLVLVIACANLANLMLARAEARAGETATRMALGARSARIARQWLIENVLLTAAASLLAWWAVRFSTRFWGAATETPYRLRDYAPDAATAAYLVVVALAAATVISVVPLCRLRRLDVNGELKGESRGATIGVRAKRLSAGLVAGQMMLAIVLLSASGVLVHSLWNVLAAPIGVTAPENVLIGRIALPRARYSSPESRIALFDALRMRLAAVPGVESAAVASARPTEDYEPRTVELESERGELRGAPVLAAAPGYFRTVGATVLAGRDFDDGDDPTAAPVAIVNQRFADAYFAGTNPIGRRIRLYANRDTAPGESRTIVGVVSNVMQNDTFRRQFAPVVYVPFAQEPTQQAWFFIRAPSVYDGLVGAVRDAVAQLDAGLEILDFDSLEASVGFGLTQGRDEYTALSRQAALAPVFAGVALLLAAVGLYAVMARSIGRRTREIGVRMALGAAPRSVRRLVLAEGMLPVLAGLALGVAASFAVNRVLASQLVGVSPYDPFTLLAASAILIFVGSIGCLVPVRRAVRVNPAVAVRRG